MTMRETVPPPEVMNLAHIRRKKPSSPPNCSRATLRSMAGRRSAPSAWSGLGLGLGLRLGLGLGLGLGLRVRVRVGVRVSVSVRVGVRLRVRVRVRVSLLLGGERRVGRVELACAWLG